MSGRRIHPAKAVVGALGVGAGIFGLGSPASAAEPTQQELLEHIKALQAKVERLETREASQAPPAQEQAAQQPAGEGATVDSVLRDAERRSSPSLLQAGGITAGYTRDRFIIQDQAGNFSLSPTLQFQFRHVANFRSDDSDDDTGDSRVESGFEVRRLKLYLDGNMFGPNLTYRFNWAVDRNGGEPVLEDAWVRFALGGAFGEGANDFAVRAGQFKDPTFHEEIVSSRRQLAADRSMVNEVLGGGVTDWVQGVSLIWDDGPEGNPLRAEVGFTDGINTDNTSFVDAGGSGSFLGPVGDDDGEAAGAPSWGSFARVEFLAMGNWRQYEDFTTLGNDPSQNLLVLGGGASYTENGNTTGGGDTLFYTFDVQYEGGKLGLYGAYYGVYSEPAGIDEGGAHDMGFLAQAGYLVTERWEVFGRYDHLLLDDARLDPEAGGEDTFGELTVGLNYYLKGHAAKFTIDGTWLPSGAPTNIEGIGILDPDGDDDQFLLRTQFQLLI